MGRDISPEALQAEGGRLPKEDMIFEKEGEAHGLTNGRLTTDN